jgi:O-antigen/teichoic acid export membrane protein
MSLLKKLASETALYGISSIIGRLLTYLLVPLHTHIVYGFKTDDYGVLTILYAYIAFFNIIFTYGMETSFFRFANVEKENKNTIYQQIQTQILISTAFFTFLLLILSVPLNNWFQFGRSGDIYIQLLVGVLFFDTITALPFAYLRLENKAKRFAILKVTNILLTVFLNVFFLIICPELKNLGFEWINYIYYKPFGVGYVFLSNFIASILTALLLSDILILKYRWNWAWDKLKPILNYGIPLLFMGLAGTANSMLDKILLRDFLPNNFYENQTSLGAVGIYGAAIKMAVLMTLVVQAFKYAAEPFFFGQSQDKKAPLLFAKIMLYFVIACAVMWVAVSVNIDIIAFFFLQNPKYHSALPLVPFMLLANLLLGIYFNQTIWFKLSDKTQYGTWIAFLGAIITWIGNLIFIPYLGYWACTFTMLATYLVMIMVCEYYGNQYFPIPYHWKKIILYLCLGGFTIFLYQYFKLQNNLFNFLFGNILVLIYAFVLWFDVRKMKVFL